MDSVSPEPVPASQDASPAVGFPPVNSLLQVPGKENFFFLKKASTMMSFPL